MEVLKQIISSDLKWQHKEVFLGIPIALRTSDALNDILNLTIMNNDLSAFLKFPTDQRDVYLAQLIVSNIITQEHLDSLDLFSDSSKTKEILKYPLSTERITAFKLFPKDHQDLTLLKEIFTTEISKYNMDVILSFPEEDRIIEMLQIEISFEHKKAFFYFPDSARTFGLLQAISAINPSVYSMKILEDFPEENRVVEILQTKITADHSDAYFGFPKNKRDIKFVRALSKTDITKEQKKLFFSFPEESRELKMLQNHITEYQLKTFFVFPEEMQNKNVLEEILNLQILENHPNALSVFSDQEKNIDLLKELIKLEVLGAHPEAHTAFPNKQQNLTLFKEISKLDITSNQVLAFKRFNIEDRTYALLKDISKIGLSYPQVFVFWLYDVHEINIHSIEKISNVNITLEQALAFVTMPPEDKNIDMLKSISKEDLDRFHPRMFDALPEQKLSLLKEVSKIEDQKHLDRLLRELNEQDQTTQSLKTFSGYQIFFDNIENIRELPDNKKTVGQLTEYFDSNENQS